MNLGKTAGSELQPHGLSPYRRADDSVCWENFIIKYWGKSIRHHLPPHHTYKIQLLTFIPTRFLYRLPFEDVANVSLFQEDDLCCEDFQISVEALNALKDRKLLVHDPPAASMWPSAGLRAQTLFLNPSWLIWQVTATQNLSLFFC